jgi:hypothetical protein
VPPVEAYMGFIDELAAMKRTGMMPDGRPLAGVLLDIATPKNFAGPAGQEAAFAEAIAAIKAYGAQRGVQIRVFGLSATELNLVEVQKK